MLTSAPAVVAVFVPGHADIAYMARLAMPTSASILNYTSSDLALVVYFTPSEIGQKKLVV